METKKSKWSMYDRARVTRMTLPYVCFLCRKSFHRSVAYPELPEFLACPECGSETVRVSPDFKAPRRSETAQWRKVEMLVRAGYRFYRYGSPGKTVREAKACVTRWRTEEPFGRFLSIGEWCERRKPRVLSPYLRELLGL